MQSINEIENRVLRLILNNTFDVSIIRELHALSDWSGSYIPSIADLEEVIPFAASLSLIQLKLIRKRLRKSILLALNKENYSFLQSYWLMESFKSLGGNFKKIRNNKKTIFLKLYCNLNLTTSYIDSIVPKAILINKLDDYLQS